jgi:hypothetical protein
MLRVGAIETTEGNVKVFIINLSQYTLIYAIQNRKFFLKSVQKQCKKLMLNSENVESV